MTNPKKLAVKAEMKRRDCRYCLFFDQKNKRCVPGMHRCILDNVRDNSCTGSPPFRKQQGCSACPYGRGRPCVSFCLREILTEWRTAKAAAGKEVHIYA